MRAVIPTQSITVTGILTLIYIVASLWNQCRLTIYKYTSPLWILWIARTSHLQLSGISSTLENVKISEQQWFVWHLQDRQMRRNSDLGGNNNILSASLGTTRWAPDPSYKMGYNSYNWGYNPSYPIIRPFIGVITPFISGRGPPCRIFTCLPWILSVCWWFQLEKPMWNILYSQIGNLPQIGK